MEEGRVEEGWVDEGNERARDGTRHGQCEGMSGGRKRAEEGLSEEGREQGKQRREGNFKGGIPRRALAEEGTSQCTVYSQTIPQCGHWP